MNTDTSNFRGPGNAILIQSYIEREFPPLTWNILGLQLMKLCLQKKINMFSLDDSSEFDEEVLKEMNRLLMEKRDKGLPIDIK